MEKVMPSKGLTANQLKLIAIAAMTLDHVISVLFPQYPTDWWIVACHIVGRLAAPILWYFIAEGYHYTHDVKKYARRLFLLALLSHFAYNFAFGIPFIPFQTTIFNQTSVIWSLAWGLVALAMMDSPKLPSWAKSLLLLLICAVTFCSDWSCIAVLAIVFMGQHRGDFKRQMVCMMLCVCMYAAVYFLFIDRLYGSLQLFTALAIPLLYRYNGQQGAWRGMKWFFYIYYPLHLILCGILRILMHGNIGVIIGG